MNLKKIRLSRGLQQKELASLVGTDEPMISKFENYKCLPIPTVMALILKELGCKIEDIYEPNEVYYEQTIKPIKGHISKGVFQEYFEVNMDDLTQEAKDWAEIQTILGKTSEITK